MRSVNLSGIAVGLARAHYDGRSQGFWIGAGSIIAYLLLGPVVGVWLATLTFVAACATVHRVRPS